jgi:hypothetical protein
MDDTIFKIFLLIIAVGIMGLLVYGVIKLVQWILEKWKFINIRCSINHYGFRPLTLFRQFLIFIGLSSMILGLILLSVSVRGYYSQPPLSHGNASHGVIALSSGIAIIGIVFFWIKLKANKGVAFYSVLLMILVSLLLLVFIPLAFVLVVAKSMGKNDSMQGIQSASSAISNRKSETVIGSVTQSAPDRVTIYDDKGNFIRNLVGRLDSYTSSVVNISPNVGSELICAYDVNGSLKYTRRK